MDREQYKKMDIDEAAERLHMNQSFITMLMKKFLNSDMLEKAKEAFKTENIEEAKLAIHSIKGSAANVGMTGLSKLALEIETKIKQNAYLDFELFNLMQTIWEELAYEMNV